MIFRRDEDDFHQSSFWVNLFSPFQAAFRSIGELLDGSNAGFDTPLQRFTSFFWLPFRLIGAFLSFMVQSWTATRSGYAFIRAVPAMFIVFLFFSCLLLEDLINTEGRMLQVNQGYYQRQVSKFPDKPWDAEMFAHKLVEIKPTDPANRYRLGIARERCERFTDSFDIMTSLTAEGMEGFANAHVWLSQYYLKSGRVDMTAAERDEKALGHLEQAVADDPDNQIAQLQLASLFRNRANRLPEKSESWRQEIDKAIEHLRIVARGKSNLLQIKAIGQLSQLLVKTETKDNVERILNQQLIQLGPLARKNPDRPEIWQTMVQCAVLNKDYSKALDIVQDGVELAQEKESKRAILQLASYVYLTSANDFDDLTQKEQYIGKLSRLAEAIRVNPYDIPAYREMAKFIVDSGISPETPVNDTWLRDSLVGSRSSGVIHVLLGAREISTGNVGAGRKHWVIAKESRATIKQTISNLILVLEATYQGSVGHVFDMMTLAIEMFPDEGNLYQARSNYLLRNNRFQEVIQDLETAESKLPRSPMINKLRAECFKGLGDNAQAEIEERIVQRKLNELNRRERLMVEASLRRLD